jgi:hypothetical protein
MAIKTYLSTVKGMITRTAILLSQSGDRAKTHCVGQVDITTIRDDDPTVKLDEGVLLFVKSSVDDAETVKLMYSSGITDTLEVWKLKATCVEVIKVFDTGTTVDNADLFLSM